MMVKIASLKTEHVSEYFFHLECSEHVRVEGILE